MNFGGNMRRNNKMPARGGGGGGPLMTDHLHDLELELELLKRKRQLIQHQQSEMLYSRTPANDDMRFNQPSQSYNDRFNEPQQLSFSHLYNESPDDRSFGLKRRSQPDWSSGPTDRFDAPIGNKRSRPAPFDHYEQNNTFQRAMPNQPQPLLGLPKPLMNYSTPGRRAQPQKQNQGPKPFNQSPKPFNQGPKPFNQGSKPFNQGPKKPFNQGPKPSNQGSKPFNQGSRPLNQGPKPLSQHPNFKRKQPGSGPNRLGFSPKKAGPGANSRPNFNPNKSITPKKSGPINTYNTSPRGKKNPVLVADELPSNKTNGRLELALGMIVKEIKVTYSNTPEYGGLFASIPMNRIMKQGIRDRLRSVMTGKVVGIVPDIVAEYRKVYPLETDKEIVELAAVEKRNSDHTNMLAIKLFEEGEPEEYFRKHMGRILDARWTDLLRKLEKVIIEENKELTTETLLEKLPDLKTVDNAKASETSEKVDEKPADTSTEAAADQPNDEKPAEETSAATEETSAATEETSAATEEKPAAEPTDPTPTEVIEKTDEKPIVTNSKENTYDKWIAILLARKLPHLLARNKDKIIKLFEMDNMFRNTKAAVILNTNRKAQGLNAKVRQSTGGQPSGDTKLPRSDWFFVKVLATPSMPKRKVMQEFLNMFKPKTIKRHKKNYNLLFVGLDSKENYDDMLAANQTIVGNATITISPSNVAKTNEGDQSKSEADQSKTEADLDAVLTPQLDDQINDLLSSIRKADEQNPNGGGENIDLTNADSNDVTATDSNDVTATDSNGDAKPEGNGNQEAQENGGANENAENGNSKVKDDEVQVVEDSNAANVVTIEDDEVAPLKSDEVKQAAKAPGTPAKGRAPATPSSIRTRRSSRLN